MGGSQVLKRAICAATVAMSLGWGVSVAAVHDLATDFSIKQNPNGVWSYGWSEQRGGAFNLDTQTAEDSTTGSWRSWVAPNFGDAAPNIFYAIKDINYHPTVSVPAGTVSFHPGPLGQNSVVRWTAPATRTYRIEGSFVGNDFVYPTTTDVAILHQGAEIFVDEINSYRIPHFFSLVKRVNAGETIDFSVGFGSNGSYWGDTTGLVATIREDGLEVAIDIKPGGDANRLNADASGVIPVAVLGSSELKVRQISVATLQLDGMKVKANDRGHMLAHYADVNGDGIEDLVVQFANTGEIPAQATSATLTGSLFDATPIRGSDAITLVP